MSLTTDNPNCGVDSFIMEVNLMELKKLNQKFMLTNLLKLNRIDILYFTLTVARDFVREKF